MNYFSNMSIEEYIKLNSENISPEFLVMVENLLDKKEKLEVELQASKKEIEMLEAEVNELEKRIQYYSDKYE